MMEWHCVGWAGFSGWVSRMEVEEKEGSHEYHPHSLTPLAQMANQHSKCPIYV